MRRYAAEKRREAEEVRCATAVITASATRAAATPYSESSSPVSSRKNFFNISFCSFCVWVSESRVSGPCETPEGGSRTPVSGLQLQAARLKKSVAARLRAARSDEQLIPIPSVIPVPLRVFDTAEKRPDQCQRNEQKELLRTARPRDRSCTDERSRSDERNDQHSARDHHRRFFQNVFHHSSLPAPRPHGVATRLAAAL